MKCPCYSDVYVYSNGAIQRSNTFPDAGTGSTSTDMSSSQILGLANGEVSLVTCELCNGLIPLAVSGAYIDAVDTSGQGSSWGTRVTLTTGSSEPQFFAADSEGGSVYVAYYDGASGSQGVYSASLNYGSTSANPVARLLSTSDPLGLTMTRDSYGNLGITVADASSSVGTLTLYKSTNFGASWTLFEKLGWNINFAYSYTITQTPTVEGNGLTGIAWEEGTSTIKDLEFASFPIVVPNPSTYSNSWSRPGNSPYESYFSHIDDAISPGNGLLVLQQQDLSLPGRNAWIFRSPESLRSHLPSDLRTSLPVMTTTPLQISG